MPGQRGTNKRRLTHPILVRVTAETHVALTAMAEARVVTINTVARGLIVRGADLDAADRRVIRLRTREPAPAEDIKAMSSLGADANMLNGWLVQMSKQLREDGIQDLHVKFEGILARLYGYADEMDNVIAKAKSRDRADLTGRADQDVEATDDDEEAAA